MTGRGRAYWLTVQFAAVATGIWGGVRLFDLIAR